MKIEVEWNSELFRLVALCPPSDIPTDRPEHRDMWTVSMCSAPGRQPYHWQSSRALSAQAAIDSAQSTLAAKPQTVYNKPIGAIDLDLSDI